MNTLSALLALQGTTLLAALPIRLAISLPPRAAVRAQRCALGLAVIAALISGLDLPVPEVSPFPAPIRVEAPAPDGSRPIRLVLPQAEIQAPALPADPRPWIALLLAPGLLLSLREVYRLRRLLQRSAPYRQIGPVDLRISADLAAPCSLWWGRPVVLLDPITAADPAARSLALRHELQHHRAGDTRAAYLLTALEAIAPAARLSRPSLIAAEELACDAALIARGAPVTAYARLLLDTASLRAPRADLRLCASLHHPSLLSLRIDMLLHPPAPRPWRAAALIALAALSLPLARAADGLIQEDPARLAAAAKIDLPEIHAPAVAAALADLTSTPDRRRWLRASLDRARPLQAQIEAELADAGLPAALSAVPLIESGYRNHRSDQLSPSVPAHQRGAGYWMFIPSTARNYGLRVDETTDERLDLAKETKAAIALLSASYDRYHTWPLALAAYNQGEKAVDAALREAADLGVDPGGFSLLEADLLAPYAAEVYAAALLLKEPALVF